MPIYAYKCSTCGFAKDVLQKLSDNPLTECPACAASTFSKQLTAAGFQLKGSGWYATDFKGAGTTAANETKPDNSCEPASTKAEAPAPAAASTSCAGGCSCHG